MRNIEIRKSGLWAVFNRVLVLGILPNLFFAILGSVVFLERGWLNVDYMGLCALSVFIPSIVTAILFSALFLLDVLLAIAPGFYFEPTGFLTNALEVTNIISPYIIFISAPFLAFSVFYSGVLFRFFLNRLSFHLSSILWFSSLFLLVCLFSFDRGLVLSDLGSRYNLTISTTKLIVARLRQPAAEPDSFKRVPAATDELFEMISRGRPLPNRIILVILESWGLPRDKVLQLKSRELFDGPSLDLKYELTWGDVPFFDSTVQGEMRELCRLETFRKVPQIDLIDVTGCLPALLGAIGYKATAMHNFKGSFFSRYRWYPKLGFEQILFQDQMYKLDPELVECGHTFRGFCDDQMPNLMKQNLLSDVDKSFIYWVTLNSHLPVSEPDDLSKLTWCGEIPSLEGHPAVCVLETWVMSTLQAIANFAAAQPTGETGIIIVGDHAPPIFHLGDRAAFNSEKVPSLILWPRTHEQVQSAN